MGYLSGSVFIANVHCIIVVTIIIAATAIVIIVVILLEGVDIFFSINHPYTRSHSTCARNLPLSSFQLLIRMPIQNSYKRPYSFRNAINPTVKLGRIIMKMDFDLTRRDLKRDVVIISSIKF